MKASAQLCILLAVALAAGMASAETIPSDGGPSPVNGTSPDPGSGHPINFSVSADNPNESDGQPPAHLEIINGNGDFVVVWLGDTTSSSTGVWRREFLAEGTPITIPDEVQNIDGEHLAVASDLQGNYVMLWWVPSTEMILGMMCEFGNPTCGATFEVLDAATNPDYLSPDVQGIDVAMDVVGDFVVVWSQFPNQQSYILRQLYSSGSDLATPPEAIEGNRVVDGLGFNARPVVAKNMVTRGFLALWESTDAESGLNQVYSRAFDASGEALSGRVLAHDDNDAIGHYPAVAAAPDGRYFAAWQQGRVPDEGHCTPGYQEGLQGAPNVAASVSVVGKRFNNLGFADGSEVEIAANQGEFGENNNPSSPRVVAADLNGSVIVAWQEKSLACGWEDFDEPACFWDYRYDGGCYCLSADSGATCLPADIDGDGEPDCRVEGDPDCIEWYHYYDWDLLEVSNQARWLPPEIGGSDVEPVDPFLVDECAADNCSRPGAGGELYGSFGFVYGVDDGTLYLQRYHQPVMLEVNDITVVEGNPRGPETTAQFTVTASKEHPNLADVAVDYRTLDDTASFIPPPGEDYGDYEYVDSTAGGAAVSLTFSSSLVQSVPVTVYGDLLYEEDESFLLQLFGAVNAVVTRSPGTATILNDDPGGSITASAPAPIAEPANTEALQITLVLSPAQEVEASLSFITVDGSATSGSDYEHTQGTVSFPPGATEALMTVNLYGDTEAEPDEAFTIELRDPVNAVLDTSSITVMILENDCWVGLDPGSRLFDEDGVCLSPDPPADCMVAVSTAAGCTWQASDAEAWLDLLCCEDPPCTPVACGTTTWTGDGLIQAILDVNPDPVGRSATVTVSGSNTAQFIVNQEAGSCSADDYYLVPAFDYQPSAGGAATVTVDSTVTCEWSAASNATWLSIEQVVCDGTPSPTGCTGAGAIGYLVAENDGAARDGALTIGAATFPVHQEAAFFDHFDDGVLDPGWSYSPSAADWTELEGEPSVNSSRLRSDASDGQAQAIAETAFAGCEQGTVRATMRVNTFGRGTASLLGWYQDDGTKVELEMDEFTDTWTLSQWEGGIRVATTTSGALSVATGVDYNVEIIYGDLDGDGNPELQASVDGLELITQALVMSGPSGTVGFAVDDTDADLHMIQVITSETSEPLQEVFADGFESGDTSAWSVTAP